MKIMERSLKEAVRRDGTMLCSKTTLMTYFVTNFQFYPESESTLMYNINKHSLTSSQALENRKASLFAMITSYLKFITALNFLHCMKMMYDFNTRYLDVF